MSVISMDTSVESVSQTAGWLVLTTSGFVQSHILYSRFALITEIWSPCASWHQCEQGSLAGEGQEGAPDR